MIMAKKNPPPVPAAPEAAVTDQLVARSVRLPQRLWDLLGREAQKALRSDNKQLEWILKERYGLEAQP